jgi:hypothetical protein
LYLASCQFRSEGNELQQIVSHVFPDEFMWQCFMDHQNLGDVLVSEDLITVFPYLVIRMYVNKVINRDHPDGMSRLMRQQQLFAKLQCRPLSVLIGLLLQ